MKRAYVDLPEGQVHYLTAGEGPALLLFHQAPLCSDEWVGAIPALSEHFCVYAPDMPGHGNSFDPPREYEMEDFTATALRFMEALGIASAVVCGNHSGGALATSIALSAPERVRKVIVSCEMLLSKEHISAFLAALEDKPMSRELPMDEDGRFLVEAWDRYKALAPTAVAATRFLPFVIGQAARLRPYDAHFPVLRWMSQGAWLSEVACPVLVVGAEHDMLFRQELMDAAAQYTQRGSTAIIREAGALSPFEQPAAWAQVIIDFAMD